MGPPELGADAGKQLTQAERLGYIIIGAKLQAKKLIDLVALDGQEMIG